MTASEFKSEPPSPGQLRHPCRALQSPDRDRHGRDPPLVRVATVQPAAYSERAFTGVISARIRSLISSSGS